MSLTDLQVELRSIESHLKKLNLEIENMKPKSTYEKQIDFGKITVFAKQNPITIETLNRVTRSQKIIFINTLAKIISIEKDDLSERLLYLGRISNGCGFKFNAKDIYKGGLKFNEQEIERMVDGLFELRYILLVEALVIANITGNVSPDMLSEIAEVATLLDFKKPELKLISQIAKSKLTGNLKLLSEINVVKCTSITNAFDDYIPREWIKQQRIACCEPICLKGFFKGMYTSSPVIIYKTNIIKQWKKCNEFIKKGDKILEYQKPVSKRARKTQNVIIEAPNNGKLFVIEFAKKSEVQNKSEDYKNDRFLALYAVSLFDDYKEFCEWFSKKYHIKRIF